MAGEEVRALSLDGNGVGGDRAHALLGEDGVPIEGRDAPALCEWRAAYPFNVDAGLDPANPPLAMVSRPDGRRSWRWGDPQLRNGLETALGRKVTFTRKPVGLAIRPRTVLLTDADDPVAARSNLHLELDGPVEWAGVDVHFAGGVHLRGCWSRPDGVASARA
jgi:hypothetical protein